MIDSYEHKRLREIQQDLERALMVSVKIDPEEVSYLVVSELMKRYLSNNKDVDIKNILLRYYLTEREFAELEFI